MITKTLKTAPVAFGIVLCSLGFANHANAQTVNLVPISTGLSGPVGITSYGSDQLLVSVNYPNGGPWNFELVKSNGTHARFSNVVGLSDELKLATVEQPCDGPPPGGFTAGDVFYGDVKTSNIYRFSGKSDVPQLFASLPRAENGLALYPVFDTTGVFGGDLIVGTASGTIYRVNQYGAVTRLSTLPTPRTTEGDLIVEGLTVVPDDSTKYGPWAGKIIACGERNNILYGIDPAGNITTYDLGITAPEDIRIVPANRNLYIAGYNAGVVDGVKAADLSAMVGDVLVGQEFGGQIFRIQWNGRQFVTTPVTNAGQQFEQMTFSTAGLGAIPAVPFEVKASVSKSLLWPPNHDLVNVGLAAHACPNYGTTYTVTVYSNEPDIVPGDGDDEDDSEDGGRDHDGRDHDGRDHDGRDHDGRDHGGRDHDGRDHDKGTRGQFSPDAKDLATGTLRLRAERDSKSGGRVYVVVVSAMSASGETATTAVTVVVPHSRSAKSLNTVNALAAAALKQKAEFFSAASNSGSIPKGYYLVGVGPIVGPKQ